MYFTSLNSHPTLSQFQLWKEHVGRSYGDDEEHVMRQNIWAENVKLIHEHNQKNKSYSLAMNHFGDMVSLFAVIYCLWTNKDYQTQLFLPDQISKHSV